MLFRRNSFRDFLNLTNGTLLSICAISAFQIFALTEEKDWVPKEMWNKFFALVLCVCTSLFFWYNEFKTVGKRPLLNLYIMIPIRWITNLSIVKIFRSLKIGAVWAQYVENVIILTIFFCKRSKGLRWVWGEIPQISTQYIR